MQKILKRKIIKVGILGGTFDPPHKGHVHISRVALKKLKLDKIIWIITKKNPFKKKPYLSTQARIKLSRDMTKNQKSISIKYFDHKIKSKKDVYESIKLIVCFSQNMKESDKQIKYFLNKKMYNNKVVLQKTNNGKRIIKSLFNKLSNNPKKYIRSDLLKNGVKERMISDFIAGMTDRFAINLEENF